MKTIEQQIYFIGLVMREAERLARGREWLVLPVTALLMRRLGLGIGIA